MKKIIFLLILISSILFGQNVNDYIPNSDGFITAWLLRGTYSISTSNTRDFDFLSSLGGETKKFNIKEIISEGLDKNSWLPITPNSYIINFQEFFGKSPNKVCYALTFIESQETQPVIIKCGSDDGIKIFLNGKMIHNNNIWRGVTPDEDVIKANLNKGLNTLLVKVNNGEGGFEFCLKILSNYNQSLKNIKIKLPNNFSDEEIFKSIFSSLNIYTIYDKTDDIPKFITNIKTESSLPLNFKRTITLKLLLIDNESRLINEFYTEKINNFSDFKSKEITCKPQNIPPGRYVIKLQVLDEKEKLLTEKENIVFWY